MRLPVYEKGIVPGSVDERRAQQDGDGGRQQAAPHDEPVGSPAGSAAPEDEVVERKDADHCHGHRGQHEFDDAQIRKAKNVYNFVIFAQARFLQRKAKADAQEEGQNKVSH